MLDLETLYKLRTTYEADRAKFREVYQQLTEDVQAFIANDWYFGTARMNQIIPWHQNWSEYVIKPGRGFGKNWAMSRNLISIVHAAGDVTPIRINCFAQSASDCNDVMITGESGIEPALQEMGIELVKGTGRDWPTNKYSVIYLMSKDHIQMRFYNQSVIRFYGPNKTRGKQSHLTYADEMFCWYEDETNRDAKLQRAYMEMITTTRLKHPYLGNKPRFLLTSTPQPVSILRDLYKRKEEKPGEIVIIAGSTFDNPHLPESYKQKLIELYGNTQRGQQELYGSESWEVPGALWNTGLFKYMEPEEFKTLDIVRTLVALDPAATANKDSDETGIVVVAKGRDKSFYVLEDASFKGSPREWADKAVKLYDKYQCSRIIYETNQGGDMVAETLKTVRRNIPLKGVRASKGKYARAEPIAALYEQGKVTHVGIHTVLEKQLCEYNPENFKGSPDRLDALVWGLHELSTTGEYGVFRV